MPSVTARLTRRLAARFRAARSPLPAIRSINGLIRDAPGQFDALEIHGVRQFPEPSDPTQTCCEVDDDNPSFFSVYLHCVDGGVMCRADLPTHPVALHCADVIGRRHGWPVYDCCPTRVR
ncbi:MULTISPECIES: hypothetical protein [Burkholderia cepacia complex]|uniref:hypothetical protein n=1 Tax=Burkholderia cepacia complex TaxID=87882 RepID=UPI0013DE1666|nr:MULTISPECIES: hypothetical protein [Burkholderia cepacia complex]